MDHIKCCGREMKLKIETLRFSEFGCEKCGDIVYIKKISSSKPQLLDD
ncbi:MAG: hypothetical protein HYW26_05385 [Candidatus Aenigmarchaeota archaeon]|nr:hypothetical protein [Candidatus Aenigmarchaeota archaeon]